ncbi:MAG: isoprenylcysteine carboxylmethyltransferase family protein [Nitrospirae bacterium]|nr:isoprenylcysteine carboxylmethyltransferase family protein [Candidatus Manganitrophaceae bacterium]
MKNLARKITLKTIPVYLLLAALVYLARPKLSFFVFGLPLILAGEALRLWAAGHLSKNREVTTTGPYAYVKNPLYLGTFLIMVGFCLLASQWIILGVGLIGFFSYYAPFKKKAESDRLRKIFGSSWDEYDRSVPDYIPRWTPYEKRGRHPWEWSRVVSNSEHQTALVTAVGIIILSIRFFV